MRALLLAVLLPLPALAGTQERSLEFAGLERNYLLHIPEKVRKPAALVIVLHGGGGTGADFERMTGFSQLADEEGFVAAYPSAPWRAWNDGRVGLNNPAFLDQRDDAGFIAAMVKAIGKEVAVDPARVYAAGLSNGAMLAHYLAAKRAGLVAAIASVGGGIADPFHKKFAPKEPVSVLEIRGTKDVVDPYGGGAVRLFGHDQGRVLSADRTSALWRKADGCKGEPERDLLPDADKTDGCTVARSRWRFCKGGAEVQLLREEGAGHSWPSGADYVPGVLEVCRDFGSRYVWEFLKAHPKRK